MTVQAVLDRGLARGRSIWPAFQYQIPDLLAVHVSDRAIIFGVYSGAYLHGYNYLRDITYETLAQMVMRYDQAMAELSAEEQRAVIDITAKRYIEDQTLAAKDAALLNKERKVEQKASDVDAKIAALETDRQALATKITELSVAQSKAASLIKELEARIEEQVLESANVEAEITRQQLIAQKAELDVIDTGIRALEIQAQVADAAYRLASVNVRAVDLASDISRIGMETVEVDVKVSQTEAETARLTAQTAMESLIASELEVAQAETIAYREETVILAEKEPLLDQRIELADVEINETIPALSEAFTKEAAADLASQAARNQHTVAEYENRKLSFDEKVKTSDAVKELEFKNHAAEAAMITANSDSRAAYDEARVQANASRISGAEEAARIMAGSNIVNTLTHQIGAA